MSSDKRRCHRLKIELPVSLNLPEERSDLILSTTLDISGLGFQIVTRQKYQIGQEISAQIGVSPDEKIKVLTKVVRVEERRGENKGEYLVGLKLADHMPHDEARFLKYFTKKLLDAKIDT